MVGSKINKTVVVLANIPLSDKNGASYSRIFEYAKGITAFRNNQVYLTSLNHECHEKIELIGESGQLFLLGHKKETKSHFLHDKFLNFNERKKAFSEILGIINSLEGEKVFLLYPFFNTWYEEAFYIRHLKRYNYKVFSERNERALGIFFNRTSPKGGVKKLLSILFYPIDYLNAIIQDKMVAKYNGNIVISTRLEKWIKKRNNNTIRIPILASGEVSKRLQLKNTNSFKICYTGTISYKKDGIGLLVEAIKILVNDFNFSDIELNLFGFGNSTEIKRLMSDIRRFSLGDFVKYHGLVTRKEVEEVLKEQDLLVLIRDSNLQSNFGFSTKLAEYLAASVPVLVTDVSDNKLFLEENISAYYTKYSAEDIAKSIMNISSNNTENIVKNATEVFNENFTIEVYKNELNDFLN